MSRALWALLIGWFAVAASADETADQLARLRSADAEERAAATRILRDRGDARAIRPLVERLGDADETVRYCARAALAKLSAGDPAGVEVILVALRARIRRLADASLAREPDAQLGPEDLCLEWIDLLGELEAESELVELAQLGTVVVGQGNGLGAPYSAGRKALRQLEGRGATAVSRVIEAMAKAPGVLDIDRAVRALRDLVAAVGDPAREPIAVGLASADPITRALAASASGGLGKRREGRAWLAPLLVPLLDDVDGRVAEAATSTLASCRNDVAAKALVARIHDTARGEGIRSVVRRCGMSALPFLAAVVLGKGTVAERQSALAILLEIDDGLPISRRTLLALLEDGDADMRWAGLNGLARRGPCQLPPLQRLLEDADARVRAAAIRLIGGLGPQCAPARDALRRRLADTAPEVRAAAVSALAQVGGILAVPSTALGDANADVRYRAIDATASIGRPASFAAPELWPMLDEDGVEQAALAARALGCLRAGDGTRIVKALDDRRPVVCCQALSALAARGAIDGAALPKIVTLLGASHGPVALAAELALLELGAGHAEVLVPIAVARLRADPSRAARLLAVIGRGQTPVAQALASRLAGAADDDRRAITRALVVLGRGNGTLTRPMLVALLADPDEEVVLTALRGLGELGRLEPEEQLAIVRRFATPTEDQGKAVLTALAGVGRGGRPVPSPLEEVQAYMSALGKQDYKLGALARTLAEPR